MVGTFFLALEPNVNGNNLLNAARVATPAACTCSNTPPRPVRPHGQRGGKGERMASWLNQLEQTEVGEMTDVPVACR